MSANNSDIIYIITLNDVHGLKEARALMRVLLLIEYQTHRSYVNCSGNNTITPLLQVYQQQSYSLFSFDCGNDKKLLRSSYN